MTCRPDRPAPPAADPRIQGDCPACASGPLHAFAGRTLRLHHAGRTRSVARLAGHRCAACGEALLTPDSARRYAAAGDALIAAARRRVPPA